MSSLEEVLSELSVQVDVAAHQVAKRHHLDQNAVDDLRQIGRMAIMSAFPRYDPEQSLPKTFFWFRILGAMKDSVRDGQFNVFRTSRETLKNRGGVAPKQVRKERVRGILVNIFDSLFSLPECSANHVREDFSAWLRSLIAVSDDTVEMLCEYYVSEDTMAKIAEKRGIKQSAVSMRLKSARTEIEEALLRLA